MIMNYDQPDKMLKLVLGGDFNKIESSESPYCKIDVFSLKEDPSLRIVLCFWRYNGVSGANCEVEGSEKSLSKLSRMLE